MIKINIRSWAFAFLLTTPVFYLYALHFFNHDTSHIPAGFFQWEHILYMGCSREYFTGNATLFYDWPILNTYGNGAVFFQPQFLVLGYLWKFLQISPGILMTLFCFVFSISTIRIVIAIFEKIIPACKYNKLIILLFCWGGGILSICGLVLNFILFKGNIQTIPQHIFFLDPADGTWCLNFGRSLIYPLEAYYHFLFVACIWFVLKKDFIKTFLLMLLLIVSHPYTSIEIISIVLVWLSIELFYLKNTAIKKRDFALMLTAFFLYFILHAGIMNRIEIYRQINKLNSLDWNYKAWHFVPAYAIVWWLTFFCIKNVAAFKKHFSNSNNRLFFCWGMVAFLLSVHGFAIKPIQPIHFTRGYVYAGFFLCSIPALQLLMVKYLKNTIKGYFFLCCLLFIFLFDNITWFGLLAQNKNSPGVYFTKEEDGLIDFFKHENAESIAIGNELNYELNAAIQLYSPTKGWIPHPLLTFNIDEKRRAVDSLFIKNKLDHQWKNQPVYLYCDKKTDIFPKNTIPVVFENSRYKIFKVH